MVGCILVSGGLYIGGWCVVCWWVVGCLLVGGGLYIGEWCVVYW